MAVRVQHEMLAFYAVIPCVYGSKNSIQSYVKVGGLGTEGQEFSINLDVKLTTCLPVVKVKGC